MFKFMVIAAIVCCLGLWFFLAWWKFFFGFTCGVGSFWLADMIFDFNSRKGCKVSDDHVFVSRHFRT